MVGALVYALRDACVVDGPLKGNIWFMLWSLVMRTNTQSKTSICITDYLMCMYTSNLIRVLEQHSNYNGL